MAKNIKFYNNTEIDLSSQIPDELVKENPEFSNMTYKDLSIADFFGLVKSIRAKIDPESINSQLANAEKMLKKFQITKQRDAAETVAFYVNTLAKELQLVKMGYDEYILATDINAYREALDGRNGRHVALTYLENYEHDIPDEIVDKLVQLDGIFDRYLVLYTDYTKTGTKISEEKRKDIVRERDPILFGIFMIADDTTGECKVASPRMYVIGDWADEHCDLTLGQMIMEYKEALGTKDSPMKQIGTESDDVIENGMKLIESSGEFSDT